MRFELLRHANHAVLLRSAFLDGLGPGEERRFADTSAVELTLKERDPVQDILERLVFAQILRSRVKDGIKLQLVFIDFWNVCGDKLNAILQLLLIILKRVLHCGLQLIDARSILWGLGRVFELVQWIDCCVNTLLVCCVVTGKVETQVKSVLQVHLLGPL